MRPDDRRVVGDDLGLRRTRGRVQDLVEVGQADLVTLHLDHRVRRRRPPSPTSFLPHRLVGQIRSQPNDGRRAAAARLRCGRGARRPRPAPARPTSRRPPPGRLTAQWNGPLVTSDLVQHWQQGTDLALAETRSDGAVEDEEALGRRRADEQRGQRMPVRGAVLPSADHVRVAAADAAPSPSPCCERRAGTCEVDPLRDDALEALHRRGRAAATVRRERIGHDHERRPD